MRMASALDSKRQNAAKVPVALPRSDNDASATISRDAVFKAVVGARIRITTSAPNLSTVEGTIFTADPISNFLVLYLSSPSSSTTPATPIQPGSYRFINTSTITSFQLLTLPQPQPTTQSLHLDPSTLAPLQPTLNNRLTTTIAKLSAAESRRGPPSTTPLAQSIFDALSRGQPMRWHGADAAMIFADHYLIEAPYTPDKCSLFVKDAGNPQGLERVKKVLRMEREKIALREGMGRIEGKLGAVAGAAGKENRVVSAAGGMRKGG